MEKTLLYPVAYASPFAVVRIADAERGGHYSCFGCDGRMVPKKGPIKRPHFAHKATPCNGDDALHEATKAFICQGLLAALESGTPYNVSYPCSWCDQPISVNIADPGSSIASEKTVVAGTRSDLVVFRLSGIPRVIIEIVVTHDLDGETRLRYQESGLPVVRVSPTWATVADFYDGAVGDKVMNVANKYLRCSNCNKVEEQAHQSYETGQRQAQEIIKEIKPHPGLVSHLVAITHDKFGSPLRQDTRERLTTYAYKLVWLGFSQAKKRPTLFQFRAGRWTVCADLDSTSVMKIWDVGCVPAVYAFGSPKEGCRECLLEAVQWCLDQHSVPYRRYFEDMDGHNHPMPRAPIPGPARRTPGGGIGPPVGFHPRP